MAIETKDWVGWLVTGSIGLFGVYLNWRTRQDAKQKEQRESNKRWSLRSESVASAPGDTAFALQLQNPNTERLRLIKIEALKPPGVQLSITEWRTMDNGKRAAFPADFKRTLNINEDLTADRVLRGPHWQELEHATIRFFARIDPAKPVPARPERLMLRLTLEQISSTAESKHLTIPSEPIDWKAERAAAETFA